MAANGAMYATTPQERLQAKLADPYTADALERLLDKIDVVAFGVEAIDSFLRRSEQVADSLSESISELKKINGADTAGSDFVAALPQLARTGTQVAAATQQAGFQNLLASGLLEQLGNPQTIANLQTVLSKLEVAAFALTAIDGFVRRGAEITDAISASLGDARTLVGFLDLEKLKILPQALEALPVLLNSGILDHLPQFANAATTFVESGLLNPATVKALAETGDHLSASYDEVKKLPPKHTSLLGLVKALSDPDVNRSVTLMLEMARYYGKKIK
jgi:uncharacterized protein YjgD (DUF1641 family)